MSENPYEPPKEVNQPDKPFDWFWYVNAAVAAVAAGITLTVLIFLALVAIADSWPPR